MVKWMISVSFTDKNITTGSCTIKLWFQVSISLNIVWNVWNVIILCCCTACINPAQRSSPNRKKNHIMMSIFCPWKGWSLHSGEFRLHVICPLYSNSVCVCVCVLVYLQLQLQQHICYCLSTSVKDVRVHE